MFCCYILCMFIYFSDLFIRQKPVFTVNIFPADTTASTISIASKTASSTASGYSPNYGLIGAHSSRGWRPSSYSGAQYLEFRFSSAAYVTSMEIKGAGSGYYVKTFTVRYYNSTAGAWVKYIKYAPRTVCARVFTSELLAKHVGHMSYVQHAST